MVEQNREYLPVGIDNFKELIEKNYYFVDKSLLIKELLDSRAKATLIARPRRFGKTLNMSMLRYFFEKSERPQRHLFDGLEIARHADCMAEQGRYPVIFLSFRDVKEGNWQESFPNVKEIIATEFERQRAVLEGEALGPVQRRNFEKILDGTAEPALYRASLKILSACLHSYHGVPPIILIDEYDAPIHAAFECRYYDDALRFMRNFLSGGFKDNPHLTFGVLTGILRIAKESIFSGLNNLEVRTLLQPAYGDKFGFLEEEVAAALSHFGLSKNLTDVRDWYDGYQSGDHKIYNPWSIINLLKNRGQLQAYWVNTSDNALIKNLLRRCTPAVQEDLEKLVQGGRVTKAINENIVMPEIGENEELLWSFLLLSGYLTFANHKRDGRRWSAELYIPNQEVIAVYESSFQKWFVDTGHVHSYQNMLEGLVRGDAAQFKESFERFARESLSYFDVQGDEPERFYHALVLGMLASLTQTHRVRSNHESGWGRYDVMIIPQDPTKPGSIIEFKVAREKETLESAGEDALNQLREQAYTTELRALGITKILEVGIAFKGKQVLVLIGS
ncbi:MAG: ATP-binding protein [Candidatus Dependentiae bacterium]|nr:ATP-binding protein [Candidatus Dependentiae bacterium]